ncbi:MAG: acyl-CoA/acyl-ACP dehydrogenase [Acidobacteria bacterium]|nr:acyl-CoA/acyl-ACP dehydrogenase [Acidobacteriota bacterium]
MTAIDLTSASVVERAQRISEDVAGPNAEAVDRHARFPVESVEALRVGGLLASLIPVDLGGGGAGIREVADVVAILGRGCASTAMVYAMHQIQVACLVRHGRTPVLAAYLREVAADGLLLASATTEVGIGGDVRSSSCAVERSPGRFHLTKEAPVISYGAFADGILATARRTPASPASDQVLVVCRRAHTRLEQRSDWDTLGFRGTCSNGFTLTSDDDDAYVMPDSYADISSQTMLPTSHILWASVWLGLATAAVDKARGFVQAAARKSPGSTPPAALHLAELVAVHQQLADLVQSAARRYDEAWGIDDREVVEAMGFVIAMNALKVSASQLVVDIVSRAMQICGMAGYSNGSPLSLGRLLRDAYGAALMVNNDRINANNAQLLLIHREH